MIEPLDIIKEWKRLANERCGYCGGFGNRVLDFGREHRACPRCVEHPIMRVSIAADDEVRITVLERGGSRS